MYPIPPHCPQRGTSATAVGVGSAEDDSEVDDSEVDDSKEDDSGVDGSKVDDSEVDVTVRDVELVVPSSLMRH